MLDRVNEHLATKGIKIATGTIVDATIIHAPSSTKNRACERDPAMRQTRKGRQWYFGLKAHIGMDSKSNVVHWVLRLRHRYRTAICCHACCMARSARGCHPTDEDLSAETPV